MKRALVTQAFGDDWQKILSITQPRMEAYAKRYAIDFMAIDKPVTQPVQYSKLAIGNIMLARGYEQVMFLDADVLVTNDCEDLGSPDSEGSKHFFCALDEGEFLDRKQGMVDLAKGFGGKITPRFYVNTGVFVVSNKFLGLFSCPPFGCYPNHFGEQTWMNIQAHLWGMELTPLDPAYNCMTSVESHFGLDRYKDAYIIHYAGQSNDLVKLAGQIQEDDAKLKEAGR